jgi:molecular chaperone HtpG
MTAEQHSFQAEVDEVLSIVVNSLYSHKEVFLRELISNASDALDKLAFRALTDHALAGGDESRIDLIPAKDAGTLTIRDNGIGMTKDELIANLGTIARSGSKELLRSLAEDARKDLSLIGQFGVGFYSAYLVADRVTVTSRAAGSDQAWQWQSDAKRVFTVEPCEKETRGTNVILHLKDDDKEFLDEWRLKELVRKYSDFVRFPIRLQVERGEGDDEKKEWETINSASALWTRPKSEIEDQQYIEFYKHLSHDWEPPLAWTHFKVEGTLELTGLLFVPSRPPFDLFERKARGLRLFVKRVFIMEDCEEVLPEWLRFVRGVVDSQDLPLNVSRELLQSDRTTKAIRKQVVGRVLTLLEELAAQGETEREDEDGKTQKVDRYLTFWRHFGRVLKEGVHFDAANRERIAKLLRFASSHGEAPVALADYRARMQPGQKGIYYVTAPTLEAARGSPHIEALRAHEYEVLYLADPIDEWVVEALREFDEQPLIAAAKGALDLPDSDKKDDKNKELAPLLEKVQGKLADSVKEVRLTDRLKESPACLVSDPNAPSPHLERILRANGQDVPETKRILELNPSHPIVQRLQALAGDDAKSAELEEWSALLYDQALIAEGSLPKDPSRLARAIAGLMAKVAT